MFDQIPLSRPSTPLLDSISSPEDMRALPADSLPNLATELREFLLFSVGQTGGHFGAGLGVVELTIALHYVLNTPDDRLVWDVGHQTYPHKILTGRQNAMDTIRQLNGLAGFPKRTESPYDTFGVGHSSTSISAALGMASGFAQKQADQQAVAIIGDGAMTAGMAFEALNHAAHSDANMLVVLNDNNMSISKNVGGLATYLSRVWASKTYHSIREGSKRALTKIPQAWHLARKTEEHVKGMLSPGTLFEELGFYYVGPIDGHDLPALISYLRKMLEIKGPKLLHIVTKKGKGFTPAENDPVGYHALNKIAPKQDRQKNLNPASTKKKFQDVFGEWICDTAKDDQKLIGITPAMCDGSGMSRFAEEYPDRFDDVAIAEQHAVTYAAGLACEQLKPVVAIYSTFLQRGYDQLIHDVALQNLDVTFAIDRAGLVGEDGPTHAGTFDISFLRCIPNMIIATPSDENNSYQLLNSCYQHLGPSAIRYPRGTGNGAIIEKGVSPAIGKATPLRQGAQVALLNFGVLLPNALKAAEAFNLTIIDMNWVKPLDHAMLDNVMASHHAFITLEENALAGGAGSAVLEYLATKMVFKPHLQLAIGDVNYDQGTRDQLLDAAGLSEQKIHARIAEFIDAINP